MRPAPQADPCSNVAIRMTVTSWMAKWTLSYSDFNKAACKNEKVLFCIYLSNLGRSHSNRFFNNPVS